MGTQWFLIFGRRNISENIFAQWCHFAHVSVLTKHQGAEGMSILNLRDTVKDYDCMIMLGGFNDWHGTLLLGRNLPKKPHDARSQWLAWPLWAWLPGGRSGQDLTLPSRTTGKRQRCLGVLGGGDERGKRSRPTALRIKANLAKDAKTRVA